MSLLSVVIPCYNEQSNIIRTASIISSILSKENILYEIIFVNDGSKDNTWLEIEKAHELDSNVIGVDFSRNFGKEGAIFAGLEYANGACSVVIDCDLQHPPEYIPKMYKLWLDGNEIVEGVKLSRGKESFFYHFFSELFYKIISWLSEIDMHNASDFKLLDEKAVQALMTMPERHTFFRALSTWIGFKSTIIEYEVKPREFGQSKWSYFKLLKYALSNITSFSSAPMQFVTVLGVLFSLFAVMLGVQALYFNLIGKAAEGFTTVIILLLIVGSIVMLSLGIIGYYIAKIYEEIKQRPRYLISKKIER